mgnify:CR=1 FL=1
MKKLLFIFLLLFAVSCATTQNNQVKKYSNLTAEKVRDNCEAGELWSLRVMGIGASAAQFEECMGIKTLLTIAIPADIYNKKVNILSFRCHNRKRTVLIVQESVEITRKSRHHYDEMERLN